MADPYDARQRFSDRVQAYVAHRPDYPPALVPLLRAAFDLPPDAPVVDLGAGTGILSRVFTHQGHPVAGVEPNQAMRDAAAADPRRTPLLHLHNGTAEATGLPDASAQLVVAGQAFHWFDPAATHREVCRLLQPGGGLALIWNSRLTDTSPFLEAYEAALERWGVDYHAVRSRWDVPTALATAFGHAEHQRAALPNHQDLDLEGLIGRAASSSYVPQPGHPNHGGMMAALRDIFAAHQVGGRVRVDYRTDIIYGRPSRV